MSGPAASEQGPGDLVILWSPPRCRSTAFLRVMIERGDLHAVHEPFSNRAMRGQLDLDGVRCRTDREVLTVLLERAERGQRVFVKETTDYDYSDLLADERLTSQARHTFLIREPADAIASHYALHPRLSLDEVGYERCAQVFELVWQRTGTPPLVVDSDDFVRDPQPVLAAYCARLGLPFLAHALHWSPGERSEWKSTERWHCEVSASSGIEPRQHRYDARVDNHPRLAAYYRHHLPFYRQLQEHALSSSQA